MKNSRFAVSFLALSLTLLPGVLPAQPAQIHRAQPEALTGQYVVLFTDDVENPEAEAERLLNGDGEVMFIYEHGFLGFAAKGLTAGQASRIGDDPVVRVIEENVRYTASGGGVQFRSPWGLDRVDQRLLLPNLFYFYDHTGAGIHAYILDTGIRTTHSDFGGRARWGVDCTGTNGNDANGHGTGVASIVGGTTYGVAKDAQLVAVKVLGPDGSGSLAQVLCGMAWTLFDSIVLGHHPAVASLAATGPPSFILDFAIEISQLLGVQYSVAAGNNSADACNFSPARSGAAITVAASSLDIVNILDVKPPSSNFGSCVDIFAPGVNIPVASNTNDTASTTLTGTSAATAHTVGVAAAWLEAVPNLTPDGLKNQILTTATTDQISSPMGSPNLLLYKKLVPLPSISQASSRQRVHDFVTLTGSDFGPYSPSTKGLFFWDLATPFDAGTPYVWRDDFIQARVPPGNMVMGTPTPITKTRQYMVVVVRGSEVSNLVPFQVITSDGDLGYTELTSIDNNHTDQSTVLGNPNYNLTRTKDAEVGDVNGDGYPDLVDNNSWNARNQHHGVVRFNDFPRLGTKTFSAFELEPTGTADNGTGYLTTILPPYGTYIEDGNTYDSDLVDLNNDGLPDLVQVLDNDGPIEDPACSADDTTQLIRVLMNNNPTAGFFLENSYDWFGDATFLESPDDIDHWDIDHDGFVDIGVSYINNPTGEVFFNQEGESFAPGVTLTLSDGTPPPSAHDILFLNSNNDGFGDVILINEKGDSELFEYDTGNPPNFISRGTIPFAEAKTGVVADFNFDGFDDFALANNEATVFFNDPLNPGTFTNILQLPDPVMLIYDLEAGDVNLDGFVDIIAASYYGLASADQAVVVWLNDGNGTSFTNVTDGMATQLFPGIGTYQRLSVDLIDLELDGDLDLYLTGADFQDPPPDNSCLEKPAEGRVPNQLWENLLIP